MEVGVQVQLYIFLPDTIFDVFWQNHSLVPLTFCTINHKRWYMMGLRDILEKLCYREIRKKLKNTGILAALKILKIGVQI